MPMGERAVRESGTGKRIFIKGFGNPAREDDGLGPAFVERIELLDLEGVSVEADYQLTVEDAAAAAECDTVVFVDASVAGAEPFSFTRIWPEGEPDVSSHDVSPTTVLALARDIFHVEPEAYLLGVRGYSFAMFTEGMTGGARENMETACDFLTRFLTRGIRT